MDYILLTGATGFIGSNLINHLESINSPLLKRLLILSSIKHTKYPTILHNGYNISKKTFSDYNIESVLHLGAFTPKDSKTANDVFRNSSNITNTISLLQSLPPSLKVLVFFSTIDVYEKMDKIINESTKTIPETIYGYSKLYCEKIIEQWSIQHDIVHQILRIGHIYGMGEEKYKKLIPETIRKVIENEDPIIFSSGNELRSFLNIKDCVRVVLNSLDLKKYIGPTNIASSVSYSVKEIVELIMAVSNKKLRPKILNNNLQVRNLVFDNKKMQDYLGKEEIQMFEGLKDEYRYFEQLSRQLS
ncbi:MAG: NAD-dependent epimerase/dehydratase [Methylococcaceae bacterium]|jgi:nucleoside-diphosphate-sugar epimerase